MRWRLGVICLLAFVFGCDSKSAEARVDPNGGEVAADIDPAVAELIDLKTEDKTVAVFVTRLEALATMRGWQMQFAECKKNAWFDWDEARAVPIRSDEVSYVIVLLKSWLGRSIPGCDVQTIILLDNQGKYLNQLDCEINSRLSRMHSGRFHTVIPDKLETDGAQLVIRLDNMSVRGHFRHKIDHSGNTAIFYWGHDDIPQDHPTKWDTYGLCRIAVKADKLKILFPGEKDQAQQLVP
jgi:hypothetical protein